MIQDISREECTVSIRHFTFYLDEDRPLSRAEIRQIMVMLKQQT